MKNFKKKKRIEKLVQYKNGALDKFVKNSKRDVNLSEELVIDQVFKIKID